jgi:protein transport protein SEC31
VANGQQQQSKQQHYQSHGQQQVYGEQSQEQQRQSYSGGAQYVQEGYQAQHYAEAADELPPGWVSLQDPSSGNTYYANQATGETTWDRPQASVPAPIAQPAYTAARQGTQESGVDDASQRSTYTNQSSTSKPKSELVSKYGDGFVSSASNPDLAYQYGNVGTSNPYGGTARPGTAAAVVQAQAKAPPVSGTLNFDSLELSHHHSTIKDTLLDTAAAVKGTQLNPVEKRQVGEAEKGIAILVKKLARNGLSDDTVEQVYSLVGAVAVGDFGTAAAIQTTLANSEWRDHKDWLKGIKILIQLASKKL